jgi:hypothetical protein
LHKAKATSAGNASVEQTAHPIERPYQPTGPTSARPLLSKRDQQHADRDAVEVVTIVSDVGRP